MVALSLLCATVIGAAGCLALTSLARDCAAIPSHIRALSQALRALPKD